MFRSCILVFNDGEMESYILVNMQWSFQMVQDCLQLSKNIGNIERWYYFLSLLQILLWAKSNIRWCQPFATETSMCLKCLPSFQIVLFEWRPREVFLWHFFGCHCQPGRPSLVFTSSSFKDSEASHQNDQRKWWTIPYLNPISLNISSILRGCCEDDEMGQTMPNAGSHFFPSCCDFTPGDHRFRVQSILPPFHVLKHWNLQHMTKRVSQYHFWSFASFKQKPWQSRIKLSVGLCQLCLPTGLLRGIDGIAYSLSTWNLKFLNSDQPLWVNLAGIATSSHRSRAQPF